MKNKLISLKNGTVNAARTVGFKSKAGVRLGTNVAVSSASGVTYGVGLIVASAGAVVAMAGAGVYIGGAAIMGASDKVSSACTKRADAAFDDLFGRNAEKVVEAPIEFEAVVA